MRGYRAHEFAQEQRAQAAQARAITAAGQKPSPLFAFGADLVRSHARELILSKPAVLFGAPPIPNPDVAAEVFTEGRVHRRAPAPVNYHAEG